MGVAAANGLRRGIAALAAAVALAVSPTIPAVADFTDGLRALDGGDYATTVAEWRPLAEAGNAEAQAALADLYARGLGVPQSLRQAAEWYALAARQGHVVAQLNLGDMYATGRGVRRDPVEAYFWLSLAAARGSAWAARRRNQVAVSMTAGQIAEAERRIRSWNKTR